MKFGKILAVSLAGTSVLCALLIFAMSHRAYADPGEINGTVFYDINNNGVHDPGEPGMEGLLVRFGTGSSAPQAFTDADGRFEFTGLSGTANLEVFTGWFRSQCDSMFCPAGPGADNDFAVINQFIVLEDADADTGGTFNVGVIPDWDGQGTYATYPADGTEVLGTPVDIAVRSSYGTGCGQGTTAQRLCSPGDRIRFRFAFFNQGTDTLSNPIFALQVPIGHVVDDASWFDNGQAIPTADNVSVVRPFDAALGYGIYRLDGTIPRGASSTMFMEVDVTNDAIGSPEPYATADPRDKQIVVQILQMDQTGDWDSDLCLDSEQEWQYGTCALNPLGQHNKILATDHSEAATWNVTGDFVPRSDQLQVVFTLNSPGQLQCGAGAPLVESTVAVTNQSTGDSPLRNIEIMAEVPEGLIFNLADNPGWFIAGDGSPRTFINLHMLPGATVEIPLYLQVDATSDVCESEGEVEVTPRVSLLAYDTAIEDGDTGMFIPGSMSGVLSDEIQLTLVGAASSGPDDEQELANTGLHSGITTVVAGLLTAVAVVSWRSRRHVWRYSAGV